MCAVSTCAESSSIFAFVREHSGTWHWDRWALILKLLLVGSCLPHFSAEQSGRPAGHLRFWTFGGTRDPICMSACKGYWWISSVPCLLLIYNSEQCVMQILLAAPDYVVIWVSMVGKKYWLKFWVAMGMLDCDCGWFGVPGARVCSTIWTPGRPTGETSDTRGVTRRVMDTPAFSPHNYYQIDDAPKATWRPKDISRKEHTGLSSDGRSSNFSTAHYKYQSVKNIP